MIHQLVKAISTTVNPRFLQTKRQKMVIEVDQAGREQEESDELALQPMRDHEAVQKNEASRTS